MKFRISIYSLIFLSFGLLLITFRAAGLERQENPRDRLERLREEVDSLSTVLDNLTESERGLGRRIQALDKQIAARQSLINELESERRTHQQAIRQQDRRISSENQTLEQVEKQLAESRSHLDQLRDQISRRAVYLYKQGDQSVLNYLLASESPNEFLRRQVYVRRIHERDDRNMRALKEAVAEHEAAKEKRERTLTNLRQARAQKAAEVARLGEVVEETAAQRERLRSSRGNLDNTLAGLRQDREAVSAHIQDRETAISEVRSWIASLEEQRISGGVQELRLTSATPGRILVRDLPEFATFASARGRLPWPVKGKVISRFGMETNAITGTVTENPGIDIEATEGNEVLAVQDGVCTRITYMRGFGTTVLVAHEEGYYTVYAHLASVWIAEGEPVQAGRVLGTVGRTGGAETPRLHFQVWHKQQKQDPLTWLSS